MATGCQLSTLTTMPVTGLALLSLGFSKLGTTGILTEAALHLIHSTGRQCLPHLVDPVMVEVFLLVVDR